MPQDTKIYLARLEAALKADQVAEPPLHLTALGPLTRAPLRGVIVGARVPQVSGNALDRGTKRTARIPSGALFQQTVQ